MQKQADIHFDFNVAASPERAYAAISDVKGWWIRDTEGPTAAAGDSFTVHFDRISAFVRFSVAEAQQGSRCVWHVDDCFLPWFQDKTEWNGTDVIFDIIPTANGCSVAMVHRGITPEVECYNMCNPGWEGHVMKSLYKLISEGAGTPK
jgi:hypothetical protein